MSVLDPATRALVWAAAGLFDAPQSELAKRFGAARAAGASATWLDELVLAAVLFVGFPRALVAAAALRSVEPFSGEVGDATQYQSWKEWLARGEETCRKIYGGNYDRLRSNVAALHPALDLWILVDGYGRTLSRPGLDARRRELCAIAMLVPQDASRQLHSHMKGALNLGATTEEVDEVLEIVGACVPRHRSEVARALWEDVRS